MRVALLLYAYCTGVTSSRKIERKTQEDVAFRVLAANQSPDHSRISEFRRRHGVHFENLFVQMLKLCAKAGLVKLGHVALDGTKLKANASTHKAMSHERMQKEEEKLREKVQQLLAQVEAVDAEEDARPGTARAGAATSFPRSCGVRRRGCSASAWPFRRWRPKPGAPPRRTRARMMTMRVGKRVWLPFLRARRYMESRQSLLEYSLTQFFKEAERSRP